MHSEALRLGGLRTVTLAIPMPPGNAIFPVRRSVAARLVEAARGGDVSAARLLFSYAIGKPVDAVDPDTLDVREWALFGQSSATAQQVEAVLVSVPVPLACDIARAALPGLRDAAAAQLVEALTQADEPDEQVEESAEVALPAVPLPSVEELRPPRRRCGKGEAKPLDSAAPPAAAVGACGGPNAAEAADGLPAPVVPHPHPAVPSQQGSSASPSAAGPASATQPAPSGEPVPTIPPGLDAAPERWGGGATAGQGLAPGALLALLLRGLGLPSPNGCKPGAGGTHEDGERL